MKRNKLKRSRRKAKEANELGKDALIQAQAYVAQAQDYLGPRAQGAWHQAQEYLGPRAQEAKARGARLAASAVDTARPRIDDALDRVGPTVEAGYQRVLPVIDQARGKLQNSLLPWLSDTLHQAAEGAASLEVPEVARHITTVEVEPEPKKSRLNSVGKVLLVGGLVAVIVFAIKKFLAPVDSGWQAYEPSAQYVPPATPASDAEAAASSADQGAATETSAADPVAPTLPDETPVADSPYGAGSYVGTEPPEDFVIKGNERSMKFHVKGNGGYERTIPDVWFNSEEAAEAAGFTKAQR
ncbi:MAG: hypothetical protein ACK5LN_08225 [Propioniciclava sp.]